MQWLEGYNSYTRSPWGVGKATEANLALSIHFKTF